MEDNNNFQQPMANNPAGNNPAGNNPAGNNQAGNNPAGNNQVGNNPARNNNFNGEAKKSKGFISTFFKSPLEGIKTAATDAKGTFFKIAIIIFVIWIATILVSNIASLATRNLFGVYGSFEYFIKSIVSNIFTLIKELIAPVILIAATSGLAYAFMKNKNKSFLSVLSAIIIAKVPVIIAEIVNLLTLFGSGISKITTYFSSFCTILSTVLLYFAIKHATNESEDEYYFWKYVLIIGIITIIRFVLSYLGIYI